jgi:hypothetical protein
MASILKFFRIIFFYALYFLMCMVAVVTVLQGWPVGGQMLFAIGLPLILVWWQESRRTQKNVTKIPATGSTNATVSKPEPAAQPSGYEKRIELERQKTRDANTISASSSAPANAPPKQTYTQNAHSGKVAEPAFSPLARQYENVRPTAQKSQTNSRKNGWVPAAETATVARRDIGGMVYVGTPPLLNHHG